MKEKFVGLKGQVQSLQILTSFLFQECFNSPYGTQYFKEYAEKIPGESTQKLSEVAKECSIYLVGGSLFLVTVSLREKNGQCLFVQLNQNSIYQRGVNLFSLLFKGSIPEEDGGKLYNTCTVFGPDGAMLAKHRKVRWYDIVIRSFLICVASVQQCYPEMVLPHHDFSSGSQMRQSLSYHKDCSLRTFCAICKIVQTIEVQVPWLSCVCCSWQVGAYCHLPPAHCLSLEKLPVFITLQFLLLWLCVQASFLR